MGKQFDFRKWLNEIWEAVLDDSHNSLVDKAKFGFIHLTTDCQDTLLYPLN